jgi:hypothetical protein
MDDRRQDEQSTKALENTLERDRLFTDQLAL